MMEYFRSLWKKGVSLGVFDTMPFSQRRALRNFNALAIACLPMPPILSVMVSVRLGQFHGLPMIGAGMISLSLLIIPTLNYYRQYFLAKILHYALGLSGLLINVFYYGADFGIEFFILIMFIGAFTFSENKLETLFLSLMAAAAFLVSSYFSHFHEPAVVVTGKPFFHILFLSLTFLIVYSSLNLLKTENSRHNETIHEKNELLTLQREELLAQHDNVNRLVDELSRKNVLITSSIDYAQKLQQAILPTHESVMETFPEVLIYYRPKDVVSGDFYWYYSVNSKVYLAVADCTGHGVPGALLSMLGSSILHQIVQSTLSDSPGLILKYLNIHLNNLMANRDGRQGDGIDIALAVFDLETSTVKVASTNRPYVLISSERLSEFRGSRVTVGTSALVSRNNFDEQLLTLQNGDVLYFFTDGMTDQFDFQDRKKYGLRRLKDFLFSIHHLAMDEQKQKLKTEFETWQGETVQTDDILLLGIRFGA